MIGSLSFQEERRRRGAMRPGDPRVDAIVMGLLLPQKSRSDSNV